MTFCGNVYGGFHFGELHGMAMAFATSVPYRGAAKRG